ncbi:hypothetical protein KP509_04G048200 [Ceratopteris richardii]|uniref:Uncharacterized protein n=1 Tax=Ceratopteris richardii TaxID=49495 RepID=A0A8T2V050_CERRI|nr:hypothetical protein KP509_04G048200 [Ceratopteris richardii]KAH7439165.1 hypothetical protein KP509_04G048200 [Ceratopteris richardii]
MERQHTVRRHQGVFFPDSRRADYGSSHHCQGRITSCDFDAVQEPHCGRYLDREKSVPMSSDEPDVPHDEGSVSPSSPTTYSESGRTVNSPLSLREASLSIAWERKRELMSNGGQLIYRNKTEVLDQPRRICPEPGKCNASGMCGLSQGPKEQFSRSLTDEDFEELRGCIDLGFGFDHSSVSELCDTLPALKVYCAVAQGLQESPTKKYLEFPTKVSKRSCSPVSPVPSWRISSPGDDPMDVKDRLRQWAQAVACDARLCF